MTWTMYQALVDACETVDTDTTIKALILRGAGGKAFGTGTDINQFRNFKTDQDGIAYETYLDTVLARLEQVNKPTIAQIQGIAAGGSLAIAITCDLRLSSPESSFGVPIARTLGNCLSASTHIRFIDLIGPARLKDIIFTGRLIDAQEAVSIGLINRVINAAQLEKTTVDLARDIAANAPLTINSTKEMLRRIQSNNSTQSNAGHDLIAKCYTSNDFREGVDAFLAKRSPRWQST